MQTREKVFRASDIQRCRRHLLQLAVLTLAILPFVSAIAKEESPVSLKLVSSAFEEGEAHTKEVHLRRTRYLAAFGLVGCAAKCKKPRSHRRRSRRARSESA